MRVTTPSILRIAPMSVGVFHQVPFALWRNNLRAILNERIHTRCVRAAILSAEDHLDVLNAKSRKSIWRHCVATVEQKCSAVRDEHAGVHGPLQHM